MLADDALGNGKAESGARGPTTDHGVKDVLQQLRRDARAVVYNVDPAHQSVTAMADGELPQGPAAKGNGGRCGTPACGFVFERRLHGVAGDVQEGLDQLLFV